VTVNNAGEGDATGVILTDTLPADVDFISASSSCDGTTTVGEVTCALGDLASGDDTTVTIVVQPTATGTITNSVAVTSFETDDNPSNNTDSEMTTVMAVPRALRCNGLVPTIVGTPGDDTNLRGTNGPDVIHGLGGNDTISGLNGNDVICEGEDNDTLSGNNGIDRLFGENGTDALNGNNGNDALDGGADTGTDTCNGGNGSDTGTACESVTSIP
jgi:Ca2+-binding RTX toxin-like protein